LFFFPDIQWIETLFLPFLCFVKKLRRSEGCLSLVFEGVSPFHFPIFSAGHFSPPFFSSEVRFLIRRFSLFFFFENSDPFPLKWVNIPFPSRFPNSFFKEEADFLFHEGGPYFV